MKYWLTLLERIETNPLVDILEQQEMEGRNNGMSKIKQEL
jgi:hypothetical protein